MKNIYYFIFSSLFLLFSCQVSTDKNLETLRQKVEENTDSTITLKDKILIENFNLRFGHVTQSKTSDYWIIPMILEEKYFEKGMDRYDYANYVFYNPKTKKKHLLLKDSIDLISNFRLIDFEDLFSHDREHEMTRKGEIILFELVEWKTNAQIEEIMGISKEEAKKRRFDLRDRYYKYCPKVLFMCDVDGQNIIQLTASQSRLESYSRMDNSYILLVNIREDDDKSGLITSKENNKHLIVDMANPKLAIPLFDKSFEDSIKTLVLQTK